jgi:hypothetical protein
VVEIERLGDNLNTLCGSLIVTSDDEAAVARQPTGICTRKKLAPAPLENSQFITGLAIVLYLTDAFPPHALTSQSARQSDSNL